MAIELTSPKYFLGTEIPNVKVLSAKIDEIIVALNDLTDGSISTTSLTLTGTLAVAGITTSTNTTQSTNKDTGAIVTEGGLGVEKNVNIGGALGVIGQSVLAAGTVSAPGLVVGANDNGIYEVSATQQGFTIGNTLVGGYNATGLFTGSITEQVVGVGIDMDGIKPSSVVIKGPQTPVTVATGAAITATQLLTGYFDVTGATGNVALPTAANITSAFGTVRKGTIFEFTVNAVGMTAANIVTLTLGAGITAMSAPALTGGGSLAVTQDTQVIGRFQLVAVDAGVNYKISRIA